MEYSSTPPPERERRTVAWAKERLGRVAALEGRPIGPFTIKTGSLNGSPERITAVELGYGDAKVKTIPHPVDVRPGLTLQNLSDEAVSLFDGPPEGIPGDELGPWLERERRRPLPRLEPSPEPLFIAGEARPCLRTSAPHDGVTARLAELDGLVVVLAGRAVDGLRLAWA